MALTKTLRNLSGLWNGNGNGNGNDPASAAYTDYGARDHQRHHTEHQDHYSSSNNSNDTVTTTCREEDDGGRMSSSSSSFFPPSSCLPPRRPLKRLLRTIFRQSKKRRGLFSLLVLLTSVSLISAAILGIIYLAVRLDNNNNAHINHLFFPSIIPLSATSILLGFGLISAPPGFTIDPMAPKLVLPQGTYVGATLEASRNLPRRLEAFLGLPYAQTTGGENRFRPPRPLPRAAGSATVFEALRPGEVCAQMGKVGGGFGENCLNLNLYRPAAALDESEAAEGQGQGVERRGVRLGKRRAQADEERGAAARPGEGRKKRVLLPIVVYVHGGAFNAGAGGERNMASFVAWSKEPIIGINFNYRVGALGFLPSALTAREGLLNLGLKDQQALFEWVKDNAEALGGDPENITIMGLSAGAHSIGHHIMHYARSPKSTTPFAKAILESGATTARAVFYPTHPRHLVQFREFLIAAGLDGVPEEDIFTRLREIPLETIINASKSVWDLYSPSVTWPFQPVVDGPNPLANSTQPGQDGEPPVPATIIPELPISSWRHGQALTIPIITGYNTNEGTVFIPPNANTNAEFRAFFKALIPGLHPSDLDEIERLYPDPVTHLLSPYRTVPEGKGRQWARLDAAYSHYAYICPVLQTAHFMSTLVGGKLPVYVYRFAARGNWGMANHVDQAPLVVHDVGFLDQNGGMPGLSAVAGGMHDAWSQFVVSRDGRIDGNVTWGVEQLSAAGGGGEEEKKAGSSVVWPEFATPFARDRDGDGHGDDGGEGGDRGWLWGLIGGDGGKPPKGTGRVMVFGEGNDERMGGGGKMQKGVPAQVKTLTPLELEACRFWWSKIELSEGLGRPEEGDGKRKIRAKL